MSRKSSRAMRINARFLKGPGGQGACSVTEHGTIKKVTSKRRRSDDQDHIEEQLDELEDECVATPE